MTSGQRNGDEGRDYATELGMGDQERQRLAKLEALREAGIDPYPPRSQRTHTAKGAITEFEEWEARGQGSGVRGQGSEDAAATDADTQHPTPNTQHQEEEPPNVTLVGRLRLRRPGGKVTFAHIEDESGRVQVFFRGND